MKKITLLFFGFALILGLGVFYSLTNVTAATTPVRGLDVNGTNPTEQCTVNGYRGSDGHCHCSNGYTKVLQTSPEGYPHSCVPAPSDNNSQDECSDLQTVFSDLQTQYTSAQQTLTQAQNDLTTFSNKYQAVAASNPAGVTPVQDFNYNNCTASSTNDAVGCGGNSGSISSSASSTSSDDNSCDDISAQCDQLDALVTSTTQSACIIEGEAQTFASAIIGQATTTATSTTATSTLITSANQDPSAFSISVNPNVVSPGGTFTVSIDVLSSSVGTYSVLVTKDGQNEGALVSNASVSSASRPFLIQSTFQTSSPIPLGDYQITVVNDQNQDQYNTATLTLSTEGVSSSAFFNTPTNTTVNYGSTGYTAPNVASSNLIFLSPAANSSQPLGGLMQIQWGYNSYVFGNIDLYLQTVCSNGNAYCSPSTTLIADGLPVQNVAYNWYTPSSISPNSYAILLAKQGSNVVGYSSTFILTP